LLSTAAGFPTFSVEVLNIEDFKEVMMNTTSSRSSLHLPDIPTTIYVRQLPGCSGLQSDPTALSVLEQTELVYDGLLADRQHKLQLKVAERRREFDDKIDELRLTDVQKATEFKRWSDAAMDQFEMQCAHELCQLRQDYEMKFARLQRSLIEQHNSAAAAAAAAPVASSRVN